jgi:hypothetical protein
MVMLSSLAANAFPSGNVEEIQGEFKKIEVNFVRVGEYPSFNYNQVLSDYRAEISQRVMAVCKGRYFAIDTRSIEFVQKGGHFHPPPVFVYGATVLAFCEF